MDSCDYMWFPGWAVQTVLRLQSHTAGLKPDWLTGTSRAV